MTVKRKVAKHTVKHTKKVTDGLGRVKTKRYVKPVALLPEYKCKYCGWPSQPRVNNPKVCPHCHRPNWISR